MRFSSVARQNPPAPESNPLRTYPSRYRGGILLVCRKCQRKLKRSGDHPHAAELKKSLKKLGKGSGLAPIHILGVPCLKLCPKGAVTVCTAQNLAETPPTLTLIRTREDIATLYRQCTAPPSGAPPATTIPAAPSPL